MNITRSIAVAAAIVAASVALVGCAADDGNYETKAACQDAVDETTTEAALEEVLATKAECVELGARIEMKRYAGEDHDFVTLTTKETSGRPLVTPSWLTDLYEKRHIAAEEAEWEELAAEWKKEAEKQPPRSSGESFLDDYRSDSGGCYYDPTYNYDWHDDYVCGGVRQYFREWDDFVTREELDYEAREWERRNN